MNESPINFESKLNERKSKVLAAIVATYIETSTAVGSSHITDRLGFKVSPATIRAEMSKLEADGYLVQPHISAGRIPSDKGYRYFVDNLIQNEQLGSSQQKTVADFFSSTHLALEELLHETSNLLSHLTGQVSFVVGTQPDNTLIKGVQLVGLTSTNAILVIVLSSGDIEKIEVTYPDPISNDDLTKIQTCLQNGLLNKPVKKLLKINSLGQLTEVKKPYITCTMTAIKDIDKRINGKIPEHIYYGGISNITATLKEINDVSNFLKIIEDQITVVSLIKDLLDRNIKVSIGMENQVGALNECSIVTAPYEINGETAGSISVIGPTRMRYSQAMATVSTISQTLSNSLKFGNTN